MSATMIKVTRDAIRFIYTDKVPLEHFGTVSVDRASNVEYDDRKQGWTVQLVDGMYLATEPIPPDDLCITSTRRLAKAWPKREDALRAEVVFINARL